MKNIPVEYQNNAAVIEPEIVELEPSPSLGRRLLSRLVFSLFVGILGIALCLLGAVLTITIIGASVGIPLIFAGLFIILIALFLLLGGGRAGAAKL